MRYRAVLRVPDPQQQERPVQAFHPTLARATEWAEKILGGGKPAGCFVQIFEVTETEVKLLRL